MSDRLSPYASVSATRGVLEAYGLATKKALGQHFLVNDAVVRRICDLAGLSPDDAVVEIGPGIGTLTVALLKRAGRVVAIERDTDLPAVLACACAGWSGSFSLVQRDALQVKEEELPFLPNKLVANLPYAVGATLVLDYFERFGSIASQTVMLQSEVVDRITARIGTKNYGAYTVKLGMLAEAHDRFTVSEGNFFPPPRVKSAVVRLDRRNDAPDVSLRRAVFTMADAAFANRRKTIANSMRSYFTSRGAVRIAEAVPELLCRAGIEPGVRGEQLGHDEFVALGQAFGPICDPAFG